MAAILQQPVIQALVFGEDGCHPVIELTTGWLLGTIRCFDGREHTPSSGFGRYPSTYEVISLFVLFDRHWGWGGLKPVITCWEHWELWLNEPSDFMVITYMLGFCLYPIDPGRFSNRYRTGADRCTPTYEGWNDVFSALYMHWPTAPKVVVYDFACQLAPYSLLWEPQFFCNTQFLVNQFHASGHTKCSKASSLTYAMQFDPNLQVINTWFSEKNANRVGKNIVTKCQYCW